MLSFFKKISTALILVSFTAIALFSFAFMMSGADGEMPGDCPFSPMGVSLCPQNTVAVAIHHISSYQQFISVLLKSGINMFFFSLISVLMAVLFLAFYLSPPVFRPLLSRVRFRDNLPTNSRDKKITRWLSLFENSPSSY
ncbi:MAG TPA: hypothetical protein VJI33_01250 [Candidatus Paceibacterota bacterium]